MTLPWTPELDAVEQKKRTEVEEAILTARGRISVAAEALEVPRSTLQRWLKGYGLTEEAAKLRLEAGMGTKVRDGEKKGLVVGRPRKHG